jgi:hypothetical protein
MQPAGIQERWFARLYALKPLIFVLMIGGFLMPVFLRAIAWILMFSPQIGMFNQAARSVFLKEFVQAFALSMRYFFKAKPTLNYPFEKGPLSGDVLARRGILAGRRRGRHT